jgi:hypothetical protein
VEKEGFVQLPPEGGVAVVGVGGLFELVGAVVDVVPGAWPVVVVSSSGSVVLAPGVLVVVVIPQQPRIPSVELVR